MMAVAWDHNPQGGFHEAGVVRWSDWLFVGGSWFVVIAIIISAVVYVGLRAWTAASKVENLPPAG